MLRCSGTPAATATPGEHLTEQRKARRTASKQQRREQLIKAALQCIARQGIANTSIADVAQEAGLSQGIINLHFQSKERLFVECLKYIADEYRSAWEYSLAKAGSDPGSRLAALVAVDFRPRVCERRKLAVWFAFWGEARSRPTYAKICAERDLQYENALASACQDLIEQGGYRKLDARTVSLTIASLNEGLWLDMLIVPHKVSRRRAMTTCNAYLATVFPRHFEAPGD